MAGQIMNFQGKVPDASVELAREVMSLTQWQKYVVYDLMIELAVLYRDVDVGSYDPKNLSHDSHKTTHPVVKSPEMAQFRLKKRISKHAEVFRNAMHAGAAILSGYMNDSLPKGLNRAQVFAEIKRMIGDNKKFAEGLAELEALMKPKARPKPPSDTAA